LKRIMQSKTRIYAQVMAEALHNISEKEAATKIKRLKHMLYKRGDFKHTSAILREFSKMWRERNGKTATIVTAQPLAQGIKQYIEQPLRKSGYALEEKVDERVIGGIVLYLGSDYVIDSTMKGKLQRLAKNLKFEQYNSKI
jgi:F0F1-type ATP synthase delta subunit